VARLGLTYLTGVRTKPSLITLVLVAAVFAAMAFWLMTRREASAAMMGSLLLALTPFALLPGLFVGGQVFRVLSGTRVAWLAPYARVKMLAAIVLVLLGGSVLMAGAFSLFLPMPLPGWTATLGFAALMFLLLSFSTWVMFLPPIALLLLPVGIFPALYVFGRLASTLPEAWTSPAMLVSLVSLVACSLWGVFAAYYLRARAMKPVDWTSMNVDWPRYLPGRIGASSRLGDDAGNAFRKACAVYWHARPSRSWYQTILGGLVLGLLFLGVPLVSLVAFSPGSFPLDRIYLVVPMGFTPLLAILVNGIVRRARLLWLRSASPRGDLFVEAEKAAWQSDALHLVAGAVLMQLLLLRLFFDVPPVLLLEALLPAVAGAVFAMYLGMMYVRGLGLVEAATIFAFGASLTAAGWIVLAADGRFDLLLPVAAFQIAAALACRAAARRRWVSIDWLRFKPMRTAGLRA
jgi:hypothetical protein